MTDEKKTETAKEAATVKKAMISQPMAGKTDDEIVATPDELSRVASALKDAIASIADAFTKILRKVIRCFRKLAKQLDPKWQRRNRRAIARSRRNNLYLKSVGRCR